MLKKLLVGAHFELLHREGRGQAHPFRQLAHDGPKALVERRDDPIEALVGDELRHGVLVVGVDVEGIVRQALGQRAVVVIGDAHGDVVAMGQFEQVDGVVQSADQQQPLSLQVMHDHSVDLLSF